MSVCDGLETLPIALNLGEKNIDEHAAGRSARSKIVGRLTGSSRKLLKNCHQTSGPKLVYCRPSEDIAASVAQY